MEPRDIISLLYANRNKRNIAGMNRYDIVSKAEILGVSKPALRRIAKNIGRNHKLALELWESGIHEARILASIIADPDKHDEKTMDSWVRDIDNWDLCDQCVLNLFWRTTYAVKKAKEWSLSGEEFVRRAGIVLMARLAWRDKTLDDGVFIDFLEILEKIIDDKRRYVWKAIVWALKKIGLRNKRLKELANNFCNRIRRKGQGIVNEVLRYLNK